MFPKKLVYRCFPLIVIALGRILTDMHAAYCGFASTDSKTTLQLQPVRHGVQHTVQAVPGGWGTILLIVDSEIVISTHVLLPDTGSSLGQLLLVLSVRST